VNPPGLDSCGGHQARAYARGRYAVFDVRPPNCIHTQGRVVPIDVIPVVCSRAAATYLNRWIVDAPIDRYSDRLLVATPERPQIMASRVGLVQILSQRVVELSSYCQQLEHDLGMER
jgi:hypothetical protein